MGVMRGCRLFACRCATLGSKGPAILRDCRNFATNKVLFLVIREEGDEFGGKLDFKNPRGLNMVIGRQQKLGENGE